MIAKFETGAPAPVAASGASNGSGMNTFLILLGLGVVAYLGYQYIQKQKENDKNASGTN